MSTQTRIRIGPRMQEVADYVRKHPGRAMLRAAEYAGPYGSRRYGYAAVHRAIRAGLVATVYGPRGSTLLFPPMTCSCDCVGACEACRFESVAS